MKRSYRYRYHTQPTTMANPESSTTHPEASMIPLWTPSCSGTMPAIVPADS